MIVYSYYFPIFFDSGSSGDGGGGYDGFCLCVFPFLDFASGCDF